MPGTGSVHAHNTAAADAALPSMDAAIFVLTADPPVSAAERELLRQVSGLSVASRSASRHYARSWASSTSAVTEVTDVDCSGRRECGTKDGLAMRLATNCGIVSLMASTTAAGKAGAGGDTSDRERYGAARQR